VKHKWLTEENIITLQDWTKRGMHIGVVNAIDRLIADRREMLQLFHRLVVVRIVDELPEAEGIWQDIGDMLSAITND